MKERETRSAVSPDGKTGRTTRSGEKATRVEGRKMREEDQEAMGEHQVGVQKKKFRDRSLRREPSEPLPALGKKQKQRWKTRGKILEGCGPQVARISVTGKLARRNVKVRMTNTEKYKRSCTLRAPRVRRAA